MENLKFNDILKDRDIFQEMNDFDIKKTVELQKIGLLPETISTFKTEISNSETRGIPIFKYHTIEREFSGYSYFSKTYKKHYKNTNQPAFFFLEPKHQDLFIRNIVICPDPIELLSYYQLKGPCLEENLLIAMHPHSNLKSLSDILNYYPNKKIKSIYPNTNYEDILNNIAIALTLTDIEHNISAQQGIIKIAINKRNYESPISKIDMPFIDKIFRKQTRDVKIINPPSGFTSFNNIVNENRINIAYSEA